MCYQVCVCVCTFSKEVKLVPALNEFLLEYLLIGIFVTEEFFYMNRSSLQNHSTCYYWKIFYSRGTGPSLANPVQRSYALEGEA